MGVSSAAKQLVIGKLIHATEPLQESEFDIGDNFEQHLKFVLSLAESEIVHRQFTNMSPTSGYSYMVNSDVRAVMIGLYDIGGVRRTLANNGLLNILADHDLIRRTQERWKWVWAA